MRIHTVKRGESIAELAREYEISEELLRAYNGLETGEGAVGEELCILRPTRSYAMQRGDSLKSLANRFGCEKRELLGINPHLTDGRGERGRAVALKIPARGLGGAITLGYIYEGCGEGKLRQALPHTSYAVICAGVCSEKGARISFSTDATKKLLSEAGVPYLLRFHDRSEGRTGENPDLIAEKMLQVTESEGAVGLVIPCEGELGEKKKSVLRSLSRLAKEKGLFLITELDEKSPEEIYELSEASIFSYEPLGLDEALPFSESSRKAVLDFAAKRGSCLGFLELPCLARTGNDFISKEEAIAIARRKEREIKTNPESMLSEFEYGKKKYLFPSLKNTKAHLELTKEAGLSGVCFDVMRTPVSTLMTYASLYKTRGALPRSNGGCIRE